MIDRARIFRVASGEDTARFAETELDEIDVVDVQIEDGSAGRGAPGEMLLTPARRFGDATKTGAQHFAVGVLFNGLLKPGPFRPEPKAHRGHGKGPGLSSRLDHLSGQV